MAGQADWRLLAALAALAGHQPVDIVRFENPGPGASPGAPLRFADLAESVPAAHMDAAAYMRAAWVVLSAADPRIRPGQGGLRDASAPGRPPDPVQRAQPARDDRLGTVPDRAANQPLTRRSPI